MPAIVLVGHRHLCPVHGDGTVTTGTSAVIIDDRHAACIGDSTSCGATITSGSSSTFGGQGIARKGDKTSHGGPLVAGYDGFDVE